MAPCPAWSTTGSPNKTHDEAKKSLFLKSILRFSFITCSLLLLRSQYDFLYEVRYPFPFLKC